MSDLVENKDKFISGWFGGMPETPCGNGSTMRATSQQREWIPQLVKRFNIKIVSDIGAGDLNWISKIEVLHDINYLAFDLVPRKPNVIEFNILKEIPRKSDLIICLWVFNHFTTEDIIKAVENIKLSGSRYLLVTQRMNNFNPDFEILESITLNKKMDKILMVKL